MEKKKRLYYFSKLNFEKFSDKNQEYIEAKFKLKNDIIVCVRSGPFGKKVNGIYFRSDMIISTYQITAYREYDSKIYPIQIGYREHKEEDYVIGFKSKEDIDDIMRSLATEWKIKPYNYWVFQTWEYKGQNKEEKEMLDKKFSYPNVWSFN
jgi:hypothetical protein